MRHDIRIKGMVFGLRPVELVDVSFIINLRSDPEHTKFMHPISSYLADQEAYLKEYFKRPGDYYFIIERIHDSSPQGTISVYNIDKRRKCGEFGRWILLRESLGAVESALLLYRVAFGILGLDMVYTHTIAENKQVVSFHQSCGLKTHKTLKDYFNINGSIYDGIEQRITKNTWATVEPQLSEKTKLIANMMMGR